MHFLIYSENTSLHTHEKDLVEANSQEEAREVWKQKVSELSEKRRLVSSVRATSTGMVWDILVKALGELPDEEYEDVILDAIRKYRELNVSED